VSFQTGRKSEKYILYRAVEPKPSKMLPVTRFKNSEAAIFTPKMLSGSSL
jgi:hypothetical protein